LNYRKYWAEFIGTMVLVLFGCGVAANVGTDSGSGYLMTALAFGLSIVAMAYSIGNISGCHVNPAVSYAMLLCGKMTVRDFWGYVIAQALGGIAGAALVGVFSGWDCGFGANALYNGSVLSSFLIEMVLTFVFVLSVLGATAKIENSRVAGLVIGLSLTLVHLLGIGFTGTSVNPARSLGPALFARGAALSSLWVFLLAPIAGAAIAAFVWKYLSADEVPAEDAAR
jgi:aquaporin Z